MVTMTSDQLTAMLAGLQASIMDSVQKLINTGGAAAAAAAETAANQKNDKPFNPRFDPKQYSRLNIFTGGDAA